MYFSGSNCAASCAGDGLLPSTRSWPQAARMSRPRLFRTETLDRILQGCCELVDLMVARTPVRYSRGFIKRNEFIFALMPAQKFTSRLASVTESLTSRRSTYSKVMCSRRLGLGKRRQTQLIRPVRISGLREPGGHGVFLLLREVIRPGWA
ncbi:MAG: hypothetical protein CM1200mP25_0530 [Acidobacteriota bacterium]|nr:MAG: hypothetical protein CM1200mP25_0530 [Acidobacteriota bacterium]